jgi:hypothetical protein
LGKFLNGKCRYILWSFVIFWWPFCIIYGRLVLFVVIWHIFPILVCLDQEKSGNPASPEPSTQKKFFDPLDQSWRITLNTMADPDHVCDQEENVGRSCRKKIWS